MDLPSIAPKKVDWDLKRNISKKLEKLEKRTQKAINELIRERLAADNQSQQSTIIADNGEEPMCSESS